MGLSHGNAVILPSRQVTGNQTNGDCVQMNQEQVDPTTQIKVIDTYAQGSRDDLSDVMGDIIMPQTDRTSDRVQIAPQQPSKVPSFHAQCSNVGSQYDTPSQIDRAGKLQARKVLERAAPRVKFSGKNNEMNFERFMERMEENMVTEGVTDELKVEYFENWFSGLAHQLVKSIKDNRSETATGKLQAIKQVLESQFGSKEFDTEGMLRKLAEGGPIDGGDSEAMQSFVVGLICKFELSKGKGDV
jgi:hypothetical protein